VPPCSSACALAQQGRSTWRSAMTLTEPSHRLSSNAAPSDELEVPSSSSALPAACTAMVVAAGPAHASAASASFRAVTRP
jgi:hypothetical protein